MVSMVCIECASIETGVLVETEWFSARHAVLVASEKITDEPWHPVDEGKLLRVNRRPFPRFTELG